MAQTTPHPAIPMLAAAWAELIASAERPALFSSRDGRLLRLPPANERLSQVQLQQHLHQLLQDHDSSSGGADSMLAAVFAEHLPAPVKRGRPCSAMRHLVAWARGCCYLDAGNTRQALLDARTAMAYATAAPAVSAPKAPDTCSGTASVAAPRCTAQPASATGMHKTQEGAAAEAGKIAIMGSKQQQQQCMWWPALLLAGRCYAAMEDWAQAVVHLAQAQTATHACGAAAAAVSALLSAALRQLTPDQILCWRSGGLQGLQQRLQDEADMRLPEVLRPRSKWYYYNEWMKQRIHLALLELHLAALPAAAATAAAGGATAAALPALGGADDICVNVAGSSYSQDMVPAGSSNNGSTSGSNGSSAAGAAATSTSSSRGRLLLSLLAAGAEEAPAVAAVAAAAGLQVPKPSGDYEVHRERHPRAESAAAALLGPTMPQAEAAAAEDGEHSVLSGSAHHVQRVQQQQVSCNSSSSGGGGGSSSSSVSPVLQLPEAVLSRLLSIDAGDLDLMVQHPVALQGQVYELLDVLEEGGPQAVLDHTIQPLSWEEVKGLAGSDIVGLPIGYAPSTAALQPAVAGQALLLGTKDENPAGSDPKAAAAATGVPLAAIEGPKSCKAAAGKEAPAVLDCMHLAEGAAGTGQLAGAAAQGRVVELAARPSDGDGVTSGEQRLLVMADGSSISSGAVAAIVAPAPAASLGWRRRGWYRADYVSAALEAAAQGYS